MEKCLCVRRIATETVSVEPLTIRFIVCEKWN